jgi:hypothetical protein
VNEIIGQAVVAFGFVATASGSVSGAGPATGMYIISGGTLVEFVPMMASGGSWVPISMQGLST